MVAIELRPLVSILSRITGDSAVCTAAHHAGVIDGTKHKFKIVLGPGKSSFKGSAAHGITSSDFGSFASSFTVSKLD